MREKLSESQLAALRQWSPTLDAAARKCDVATAKNAIEQIQAAFIHQRNHHRLLRAKLVYYDCLLAVGQTGEAKAGVEVVMLRAKAGTRLYAECASQLAVCYLRLRQIEQAKVHLRTVIDNLGAVASVARRRQFQKRVIERVGNEVLLSHLLDRNEGDMNPAEVHRLAVTMVREKSLEEIYEAVAAMVPAAASVLVIAAEKETLALMPPADRKMLEGPKPQTAKAPTGKRIVQIIHRIAWKTLCDDDSAVCSLWKKRLPSFYSEGYLAAAIVGAMKEWRIAMPLLASAGCAALMSKSCEVFCDEFKPEGLMIPRSEKPVEE